MSSRPPRIALATAAAVPALDEDGPALRAAFAKRGVEAVPRVWDDAGVAWSEHDAVLIRSTWDYAPRRDAYLAWAGEVAAVTTLLNPVGVVRWTTDKRYLRALAEAGVAIAPTTIVEPGDLAALPDADGVVIKPVVGAGSIDAARYARDDEAGIEAHVRELHARGVAAMVQPYLPSVDQRGETAIVFLGAGPSHSVSKGAMLRPDARRVDGLYVEERIEARDAGPHEVALARRALDAVPGGRAQLAYARVDVALGLRGEPVVLELELAEPSLFLRHHPGAVDRLVDAVLSRLPDRARGR